MGERILLRGARQLLTLAGDAGPRRGSAMRKIGIIADGAVLIHDGVIEEVGPGRRVENLSSARRAEELSADGKVVMPGFVDCRTTLLSGPPRLAEYEQRINCGPDAADRQREIRDVQHSIEVASKTRLEMLARKAVREFVRHGTTTLDAHTGYAVDDRSERKVLRALFGAGGRPLDVLATYDGASCLPPRFAGDQFEYLEFLAGSVLPKVRRLHLAGSVDVCCGDGGFDANAAGKYLDAAARLGFNVTVTSLGDGAAGIPVAAGAAASTVTLFDTLTDEWMRFLAGSEMVATLLPGVAFHRMSGGRLPARQLIDSGGAVALATGYSSDLCPTCSMPAILSLACNLARVTPAEAICAATINAAHAIGCGRHIGSLETGKQADIIMMNVADYREIPYHFGMNLVAMTMKRGDVIYPRMAFPSA